jgi:exopolysaccharide production protein ExoY
MSDPRFLSRRSHEIVGVLETKQIDLLLKRAFDIGVSAALIICLAPILILVSVLIKLTSRGPLLYSNERVGYRGAHFRCFKFRSMIVEHSKASTDDELARMAQEKGVLHKVRNDARITPIGAFIRRTSIDELPQLFNVLRGDMSIVGPRPLVPFMLTHLPDFKEMRSLVRPGLTGLWQIRDRAHNTSAEFMIDHDIEYVERFSFLLDVRILLYTPLAVLTGEGAY